jgi:hypothetical protein
MTQASQLSLIESSTGTITISNTGSSALTIAGGVIVAGQISGGGTRTTSASTPPSNPGVGDIWYNTLTDTVARYTSDGVTSVWLDITGPTVTNAFNGGTVTQSIIPNATASYDLGSSAYRFRTLYLTSSTIDINGGALISSVTALAGAVSGTPSSTTYLRGDATWATVSTPGGGGTVSTGTVVLTSSSSASQSITSTTWGQTVTLPDATTLSTGANLYNINNNGGYPLTILDNAGNILGFAYQYNAVIVGLASNSTAAGIWNLSGHELLAYTASYYNPSVFPSGTLLSSCLLVDSTREFLIFNVTGTNSLYGVIYNTSTQTFGTPVLITSTYRNVTKHILSATNQILFVGSSGSALGAVVLTLSGTTITVGTFATLTTTLNGISALVAQGTSYLAVYYEATTPLQYLVAFTISGTTVTIGSATTLSGTSYGSIYVAQVTSSVALVVTITSNNTLYVTPYTVSGTTITAGTAASVASLTSTSQFRVLPISSGARWVVLYLNAAGTSYAGSIITVTSTTATLSTVNTISPTTASTDGIVTLDMIVNGSKLIIMVPTIGFQILTDTSGTASVGTVLSLPTSDTSGTVAAISATSSVAVFTSTLASTNAFKYNINISGSSPTLNFFDNVLFSVVGSGQGLSWFSPTSTTGVKSPNNLIGSISIAGPSTRIGMVNATTSIGSWVYKFTPLATTARINGAYTNEVWTYSNNNPFLRIQSIT